MIRFYDTNLSWYFGSELFGMVIWAHWWYGRDMRRRRWMPLELYFVRRHKASH